MTGYSSRLAAVVGALVITISLGCGGNKNPFGSTNFGNVDTAAEAIATLQANAIGAELLVLSEDIEEVSSGDTLLPTEQPRPHFARLQETLGLTDDQMAQIEVIIDASRASRTAIIEQVRDGSLTREEARTQLQAIREQTKSQIEGVLTAEQITQFEELRANHGRQFNRRSLGDFLELTDEQRAQIETIMSGLHDQILSIREQVEAGTLTREEAMEQIKALRESERDQISALLTEEQREQFNRVLDHKRFGFGPHGFGRGPHGEFHRPGR